MRRKKHSPSRVAAFCLSVSLCLTGLGWMSPKCLAWVRTTKAFDDRDAGNTYRQTMINAGFDTDLMDNPRNPEDGAAGTWTAMYGGETVCWQNDYELDLYFDNMQTTAQHIWALSGELSLGGGTLGTPTGSGSNIVEMAASQLGIVESPANSNRVSYVQWYNNWDDDVSYQAYAPFEWCCIFVVWCAQQFGYVDRGRNDIFMWTAGCTEQFNYMVNTKHYDYIRTADVWNNPSEPVYPGDIMFFSNNGTVTGTKCHIGIVQEVGPNNSYIITIEGNTSGSCSPEGRLSNNNGVKRQRYTASTNYPAMRNGFIVRPQYPT